MFSHQLRQNFVLGLDLLFQKLDTLLLGLMVGTAFALEGRGSVLKELLLPTVEHRRLQAQFIAELGNRHLIEQMPSENGYLLFSGVVLSFFSHASSPFILAEERSLHFQLSQDKVFSHLL